MKSMDAQRGGSPSIEAAVITIGIGLLIMFAVAGGRLATAESTVDQSARAAARAASLQREPVRAVAVGKRAAESSLAGENLGCRSIDVHIDTAGFATPIGVPSSVIARVRCDVDWSDLGLPGTGTRTTEATFTSPIDQWRERTQ